tara:strand:+ start:23 stop:715 length:693 start_codon:yes stop_codon:yes gene_type:complete
MIRSCENRECSSRYFEGLNCPDCNNEGKFIMSDREKNGLGRLLAGVLRHFPEKFGVEMDINGWVNSGELCDAVKKERKYYHWLKPWHLKVIASTDAKGRYQADDNKVRATYGHSVEIEIDLPTEDIPEVLFYPVEQDDVASILKLGIFSGDRKHVHLSKTIERAYEAGSVRIKGPAIIEVDATRAIADGHTIYQAGTTVYLVEEMPPDYLFRVLNDDPELLEAIANTEEE